jgi:SAM-dependent methyltransferase
MADADKLRPDVRSADHGEATRQRYLDGDYAAKNPGWHAEDAPWKAERVWAVMHRNAIVPARIAEVGCGSGAVLADLRLRLPAAELHGFDIAPAAAALWPAHAGARIEFTQGDFLAAGEKPYDLILLLDVLEHLDNPFQFLERLRGRATHYIFHFPLDLSALSVLREAPLLHVRDKLGHIHYYTRGLALSLLAECGYQVLDSSYTEAAFTSPQRSWKTRIAALLRRAAYAAGKDMGVRLLGGETLMVLARPAAGR